MPVQDRHRARRRVGRVPVLALLAALATSSPLGVPSAAADPLAVLDERLVDATAQVRQMNAEVERVAAELTDGTRQWEAGMQGLASATVASTAAAERAEQAERVVQQRRLALEQAAAATYRQPPAATGLRVVGAPAGKVFDALRAEVDLSRVRGTQNGALAETTAAEQAAERASEQSAELHRSAVTQERMLATQRVALIALAERTSTDLRRAADELAAAQAARDAEQARLEAARQAALLAERQRLEREASDREQAALLAERQRLEREAAEQAARARTVMAPAGAPAAGGPSPDDSCAGLPVTGYSNGALPSAALCPLSFAPGHLLRADAAAAFNGLTAAAAATQGAPLCVTDSYRDYAGQVDVYSRKPGLAAVPGTSNHGWAIALDLCGGVQAFGTPAHLWMQANAPAYGWTHPDWAQAGGSRPEAWHWEFTG